MRLVICWSVSDGCTYSCAITQAIEYESGERFLVDFDTWKSTNPEEPFLVGSGFLGTDLGPNDEPFVYELEEWFNLSSKGLL